MQFLKRSVALVIAALLMAAPVSRPAAADGLQLYEQQIKAGLLYNFLKYTDYPLGEISHDASINVCLYGGDPFGGYLNHMRGLTVHEKPITVRAISAAGEASGCQLVFVNADSRDNWPAVQAALRGKPVLTVSDFSGFAQSGGMIEFTRKGDHVGATLNIDAVNAAHLNIEGRMQRLVQVVHAGKG